MQPVARYVFQSLVALCLTHSLLASADDDADALGLTSAPVEAVKGGGNTRLFVEGAVGGVDQHFQTGWRGQERLSVDLSSAVSFGPDWRAVISDRIDATHPAQFGEKATVNSLREAYVSWQQDGGASVIDLGRVNLRYGPAYGYNPTDFFRDNTLRVITTANPLSLREDRLGVFALRGQHLWGESAVSVTYAPKLASQATSDGASPDLGATNNRNRALLTFNTRLTDRVSGQFLVYKESSLSPRIGASTTVLLNDSIVAYAEGSRGREPGLSTRALGMSEPQQTSNRFAGGMTYTPFPRLSVTGEFEYNGFALDRAGWQSASAGGPSALAGYLLQSVNLQEISSRQAWFAFATLKDAGAKNLDVTALLRLNADDHSRLGWVELRYHWPRVDVALQVQQQGGSQTTEYGLLPYYRSIQLLASYHL